MAMYLFFILMSVVLSERSLAETQENLTKEEECFSQEKVFYESTGQCYKLLTKGPCPNGEWLVLEKPRESLRPDSDIKIRPVCVKERCKERELYWSANNTCVKVTSKQALCGTSSNEELLSNVFGEGECTCQRNPPSGRLNGDKKNACYTLYTQGPCPSGQILGFKDTNEKGLDSEQAECIDDPCYRDKTARPGTKPKTTNLAAWVDGKCYELGTRGPCEETYTFKVHSAYLKPMCVLLTQTIFDIDRPQDCYQDENGDCQKRINANKQQNAEKYRVELFNSVISAARKRRNIERKKNKPLYPEVAWVAHYN